MPKKIKLVPVETTTVDMENIPDVKVEPDENMQPDVNVEPDVNIQPEPPKDNESVSIEPQAQTPEPVMKFLEVLNKDIETVRKQKDKVYED